MTVLAETGSIFPTLSLDRADVRWEHYLAGLTPIQTGDSGIGWKREDTFAPLGYGGINGSKLRQLIYLVHRYWAAGGRAGVLTAASVLSPQVSMAALVAKHYRLGATIMLGATNSVSARRHENVAIAEDAGASFRYTPVAYNPALQRAVSQLARTREYSGHYRLAYGISTPTGASVEDLAAFHAVGAHQTVNLPDATRTLAMTLGSGNSATSVLVGLAHHLPPALERLVLFGVGPSRLDWTLDRLDRIRSLLGLRDPLAAVRLEYHDLHHQRFATYQDRMPYTLDGIALHPTYEGKAVTFMAQHQAMFRWFWRPAAGESVFWIVGSAPTRQMMAGPLR
jgi:1-aminocyclopropane-1-carboxylate deaminase/D-cysteine desulfhydrase-like pyridoxal-dependent ACC family enzyme